MFLSYYFSFDVSFFKQEKGSNEISLKAMGRAINKTVMIAELIKVGFLFPLVLSACLQMCLFLFSFSFPAKNRWSSSEYCNWFYWYNWCVGAARRGTSSVRIISCLLLSIIFFKNSLIPLLLDNKIINYFDGCWTWTMQPGNYSPCINYNNYFVQEGTRYILHRVC